MIVRFAEDIDLDKAVEMYDEIIDDTILSVNIFVMP